jgi:hypothetical protein
MQNAHFLGPYQSYVSCPFGKLFTHCAKVDCALFMRHAGPWSAIKGFSGCRYGVIDVCFLRFRDSKKQLFRRRRDDIDVRLAGRLYPRTPDEQSIRMRNRWGSNKSRSGRHG